MRSSISAKAFVTGGWRREVRRAKMRYCRLLAPLDPRLPSARITCSLNLRIVRGPHRRTTSIVFYPPLSAAVRRSARAMVRRPSATQRQLPGDKRVGSAAVKNTHGRFLLMRQRRALVCDRRRIHLAEFAMATCWHTARSLASSWLGFARGHLSGKRLSALGVQKSDCRWFVPQTYHEPMSGTLNTLPCLALVLYKENAVFHMHPLAQICMCNLAITAALNDMRMAQSEPVTTRQCLHLVQYATSTVQTLGGHFFKVPDYLELSQPHVYSHPELCQIAVITLVGYSVIQKAGHIMTSLTSGTHGFELIGLKWLPSLSHQQAAAITRAEPGDATWRASITHLTQAGPAVVLAVRGLDAYTCLLPPPRPHADSGPAVAAACREDLDAYTCLLRSLATDDVYYVSPSPAVAYRQLRGFFYDNELFPDSSANDLLKLLPPSHQHAVSSKVAPPSSGREPCGDAVSAAGEEHVLASMLVPPVAATSLLVLKPGVAERHAGRLLRKLSLSGFTVVALRLEMLPPALADAISPRDVSHEQHLQHLASGPCLALAVQRVNAVKKMLDLVGPTDPARARTYSPCFWRSLYGKDSVANAFYAPDSYASATTAVRLFFPDGVCCRATAEMSRAGVAEQTEDVAPPSSGRELCGDAVSAAGEEHVLASMLVPPVAATSLLVLKPGVAERHAGRLLRKLSLSGFTVIALRLEMLPPALADAISPRDVSHEQHLQHLASGPCLALAVQRVNAVKKMLDLVGPTDPARARTYSPCFWRSLYGKDSVANAFYAPDSYASATTAVRLFFPDGVCCRATAEMSRAGVAEQTEDATCTSSPRACTVLPPEPGCLHASPLVEVSCLVLLPPLVPAPGAAVKPAPYVQVVEELQRQRFSLVGARMTRLSEPQRARLVKTCELRDDKLVALLARGPCLLLAVQRDNAVSCFTQILRDGASDSVLVDYCKLILRPKTTAQACDMLALLFDRLMPGSRAEITTATAAATK
ncbi:PREDICTED: uncharacterized protein LOC106810112 [Priapulus caudatus]|uniref:Uncharacterized protein LOC106810112 n=1 Tax=Priapulus caudatus TaxID=37621 RepID=A0ABM1E9K2_PRICU|nr:PREDICTED: uncharacterized protein LOC106810112 [Priapulus caudatus]